MGNDLKLRVLLSTIDKATAPLRRIAGGSTHTAKALKAARDQLKALKDQQANITSFKKQQGAIAATSDKLNAAQEKLRQLKTAMNTTGNAASGKFKNDLRKAHEAVRDLSSKLQEQRKGLMPHVTRLREAGIATGKLGEHEARLKIQVDAVNRALSTQRDRLTAVSKRQSALASARASYDKQRQATQGLASTGAMAAASGGGALYAGARLMAPGVEFGASMSRVQAISRLDNNDEQLSSLREQARQLGGSTKFTAVEAADAQGYLGMAGFNPKAIRAAMPGMLNLAAAGGADLAQTADIASNIMSGLGMQADEMGRLGDVLVGTFTRSNTNLQMLGDTMKYAAPMAKTYGVELEVAAAMAGKLGDAGLQGSMGGTSLSTIMNRLAAPPKAASKALEELQINTADAAGNLRPMPDILKEIYDKTKDMGTAKRGGLFKAIAGEEAVKGMAQLVEQAGIGELQKLIASLREAQGEAKKTAAAMSDNLKGDLTALSSAWDDFGIELESQQDGPLRELVQSLIEVVRGIKAWTRENPALSAGLVKTAAVIAGLMVVIGGLMVTVASVLLPFIALRLMFAQLGVRLPGLIGMFKYLGKTAIPFVAKSLLWLSRALLLTPIGLAITAIAGAAYLIYANWDAVKTYFSNAWDEIQAGFSGGIKGILTVLTNFSPLGLVYQAFAGVLSYLGMDLPSRFTEFGSMIIDGLVTGLSNGLGMLKDTMGRISDSTIGWFKEKLGIHSPSRVFAELGGFTMAGLTQGLEGGQAGPLRAITHMSKQLTAAGSLALGMTTMPALAIDDRPPISSAAATTVYDSHDTYQINFPTSPGMDLHSLEKNLRAMLMRIENEKSARRRSLLADRE
ncbi:phage tail tape measure protein [Pseudomonas gessardii]|uniref:phage tail tape measure protein n=1 Tax=Pseudomonas gessardii TaxID=78544 RepID=UPI001473E18A|nr:phage tail tape measure protein [Pseudomonas gessardii]NNA66225.1 phage tail tape measure protein [Pseudomonas gessardii]